ncbi:MAG: type II toxin-antitoxin system PemK/MazF family toxin [Candidatus Paceibacterota bacterium]
MNIELATVDKFIDWVQLKLKLCYSEIRFYPKEREIWWCSLGQNIGVEVNGKNNKFERPVLIINAFNKESVFIVALSSQIKLSKYAFIFTDSKGVKSSVNLSQLRTVSTKRILRKISEMTQDDFSKILALIRQMIFVNTEAP